jgi:hypothetical protein
MRNYYIVDIKNVFGRLLLSDILICAENSKDAEIKVRRYADSISLNGYYVVNVYLKKVEKLTTDIFIIQNN